MDQSSNIESAPQEALSLYTGKTPWLVSHAWFGYLMFVLGTIGFFLVVQQVRSNGPLIQWDMPFATAMDPWARAQPFGFILLMKALSLFGRDGVGLILVALGIAWIKHNMPRELGWLLLGTPLGELIYQMSGKLVNRPRPPFQTFEEILGYGFPSGHAATNILLAWLILYLLMPRIRSRGWRIFWSAVVVVVLVGVMFSRLFLGLHYLTDMLGGALIGLAWGGLVYTSLELYYWRKHQKASGRAKTDV